MAYDEKLAERIRKAAPPDFAISERKMMGGIATARALAGWLEPALEYARALPAKPPRKPRPPMRAKRTRSSRMRAPT